jgi:chitinase
MSARRWLAGAAAAALSAATVSVVAVLPGFTASASPSLPTHLVTGYWQDFTNGAKALRLSAVPSAYTIVAVAFASSTSSPGGVSFSLDSGLSSALGGYTDAQFKADVATLHSHGQKVVISIGGQNGTVSVSDSTSATNFANSVYALMQSYGFDGVDIDLENGVNPTYMAQALQSLATKAGSSLVITMAPQTLDMQSTGMAYFQLALNIKSILTIVNTQYYNSGSMNGCNGNVYAEGGVDFLTALACIQLQGGLRPDQVGLGLPASTSGAGSGYVSPTVVDNALDCLAVGTNCGSFKPSTTWPAIRGAMTWSINWDASNGYSWVNTVSAHLATLPGGTTTSSPAPTTTTKSPTPTPTTTSPKPTTSAPPTTTAPPGALANGGFESGLASWTCQAGDSAVTSPVHSGSRALAAVPSSSTTGECDQAVHLAASHAYTLKAWVQGPYAYVGITGGPSTWASSTGWTQLSVPFTTDATGNATVYIHGWYGQGTIYADDVTVS